MYGPGRGVSYTPDPREPGARLDPFKRRTAGALQGRTCLHGGSLRTPGRGRLRDPVHAGRQPYEVAPRPHQLVLRDLRASRPFARLRAFPSRLRLLVQLLLRSGRGPFQQAPQGTPVQADGGGGPRLQATRGRAHAQRVRQRGRQSLCAGRAGHRAGSPPRATAPGTPPHRHQARLLHQSIETRLSESATHEKRRCA